MEGGGCIGGGVGICRVGVAVANSKHWFTTSFLKLFLEEGAGKRCSECGCGCVRTVRVCGRDPRSSQATSDL